MNVARLINLALHGCLMLALVVGVLPPVMAQSMDSHSMAHHAGLDKSVDGDCHEDAGSDQKGQPAEQDHADPDCDYHCLAMGPALLPLAWAALPVAGSDGFGARYKAPAAPYLGVDLRPPIG